MPRYHMRGLSYNRILRIRSRSSESITLAYTYHANITSISAFYSKTSIETCGTCLLPEAVDFSDFDYDLVLL